MARVLGEKGRYASRSLLLAFVILTMYWTPCTMAVVIAHWDFNSDPPDAKTDTGTLVPSIGNGTASSIGGLSERFFSGSDGDPASAGSDNSGWSTTVYPPQSTGNKSAGVQFRVSTEGKQNITVGWHQRVSLTASRYARFQITTNGTSFFDVASPIKMGQANQFEAISCTLTGLSEVDNNPNFAFRIVTEFEATAIGTGLQGYVTASPESYTTVGTLRFDMVTVLGDEVPTTNAAPVLAVVGFTANGEFQFLVTGAAASRYAIQATENVGIPAGVSISTNTGSFIFTDTNAVAYAQRFYRVLRLPYPQYWDVDNWDQLFFRLQVSP